MEIRQLNYFKILFEELHFSSAAEKIGITQPTLSQQIKVLEEELGLPLFDRLGKKIRPTEAGKVLYEQSIPIFQHIRYIHDSFAEMNHNSTGKLTISILPGAVDFLLNHLINEYHPKRPEVLLSIHHTPKVVEKVLQAESDFGIAVGPVQDNRLHEVPLYQDELVLAISTNHPYARKSSIAFSELSQLKLIMMTNDHPCRQKAETYSKSINQPLFPLIEVSSAMTLLQMIRQGIGASIVSRLPFETLADTTIKLIKFQDKPPLEEIYLFYRKDKFIGSSGREFIRLLQVIMNHR